MEQAVTPALRISQVDGPYTTARSGFNGKEHIMLAASLLVIASTFVWPSPSANWPPRTTVEELDAMVEAGNYHLIRQQKVGHQIEAVGIVELVGPRWPLVKIGSHWQAHLFNVPENHGLKAGDQVKFRA